MSRPKDWDAHHRRELTRKSREARASDDRLDTRTDQWLADHADVGADEAADVVAAALVAAYGTTTLEEAVEKLRWTLGKRQHR